MIEFKNVTFAYSSTDADGRAIEQGSINGLDLTIQNGEFVVLTGGSGSGKTTITRLINGLIRKECSGYANI